MKFRDFNVLKRKNFVIFSLVMMLGLIGYINYNLNKQSLLQTSSELEKYEMKLMEESGVLNKILDDEELVLEDTQQQYEKDAEGEEAGEEADQATVTTANTEEEMDNAIVVDSLENNVEDTAKATSAEITKIITSKEVMQSNAYFIESKMQRDKKRSEMMSYLNSIVDNAYTAEDVREQAQTMKMQLVTNTDKELMIENMITAKGFNDAIVYLTDQTINIVVQSPGLNGKEVAQIVDIVRRETEIVMDNIIIMNKK
ncbi:SpoIIIAH-like family protein [Alkaliphilus hydrothermalis]|uniref:Stage III sporulation protein AH n=1 Tax=Alkaliphilus hydrothermalis TaxID=1482730 RepID=A0ABS2NM33_9FIRM|nr:SpoIIIAH-like family protein [Alkaliphilus hydrothermalis]MBM7614002.1 stage III sporulation protein AH [Alkaliphilus hydrothermalis]